MLTIDVHPSYCHMASNDCSIPTNFTIPDTYRETFTLKGSCFQMRITPDSKQSLRVTQQWDGTTAIDEEAGMALDWIHMTIEQIRQDCSGE